MSLGKGGGSVQLEDVATGEAAIPVEVVEYGRVNGRELLQTSHLAEALHGSCPSSKGQVRISCPIVQPAAGFHSSQAAHFDLCREHWAEPMLPVPHRFMADIDAALMKQILDVAERERKPDIQHNRQSGDLPADVEKSEWIAFWHEGRVERVTDRPQPEFF